VDPAGQLARARARLEAERGGDLEARGKEVRTEAEGAQRDREVDEQQRPRLGSRQPGKARPVAVDETVPASRAGHAVDRHSRQGESLQVAVDGPYRHLELGGEPLRRAAAM